MFSQSAVNQVGKMKMNSIFALSLFVMIKN